MYVFVCLCDNITITYLLTQRPWKIIKNTEIMMTCTCTPKLNLLLAIATLPLPLNTWKDVYKCVVELVQVVGIIMRDFCVGC